MICEEDGGCNEEEARACVCVGEGRKRGSVVGHVGSVSAFVCVERGCTYWGVCEVCGACVCVCGGVHWEV